MIQSARVFKEVADRYRSGGRTSRPTTASSKKVPICASQPEAGASDDEGVRVMGPACVISPVRIQRGEQRERRLFQVGESLGRDGGPRSEERRVGKKCRSRWAPNT